MEVKPINKRASGQAFEVILKPPSPTADSSYSITTPPKKRDMSLEDIQKKLEAAEDRRRVSYPFVCIIYPCNLCLMLAILYSFKALTLLFNGN